MIIMKIKEICARMNELVRDIYCLNEIKKELSVAGRGDDYIRAIDDAIQYTQMRLDQYQNSNWIMTD